MVHRKVPGNVSPPLQFFRLRKPPCCLSNCTRRSWEQALDWFILPLSLPTLTMEFSLDRKRRSHKWNRKEVETFWFFRLRFRRVYDSAYDSVFRFSLGHKPSYDSDFDSDSDSVANENQTLRHSGILVTAVDFG